MGGVETKYDALWRQIGSLTTGNRAEGKGHEAEQASASQRESRYIYKNIMGREKEGTDVAPASPKLPKHRAWAGARTEIHLVG